MTVDAGVGSTLTNQAAITSSVRDPALDDNVASDSTVVAGPTFATIHGTVFLDANGDGRRNRDEVGVAGVPVTLDPGSPAAITITTDVNGDYVFSTTIAGLHTVLETDLTLYTPWKSASRFSHGRGGESPLSPTDPVFYFSTTPNQVRVNVELGDSYGVDFGDALTSFGFASLYGTVFEDTDGDGAWGADEPGIPGVVVTLEAASGTVITTATDVNGSYTFSTAVRGVHVVNETDPPAYFSTTPNEAHVDVILLGTGQRVNFGDAPSGSGFASLHGAVFEDDDANGVWDRSETGIPGVTITLDGEVFAATDVYGRYTFSTVAASRHTLVATDLSDYVSTTPNEVAVDVALDEGYRVDFGDVRANSSTCAPDIYEEDDTPMQAVRFIPGTIQAHQFCDDAVDWVKFSVRANTLYTIATFSWGRRADTFLALYDADAWTLLAANDDYAGATDYSSRIVWRAPGDTLYYVRTTNRGGVTGYQTDYNLLIEGGESFFLYLPLVLRGDGAPGSADGYRPARQLNGVIHHACPDSYEPDDTWQQASPIEIGSAHLLHSFDSDPAFYVPDKDFVWFDAWPGTVVVFTVEPVSDTQTVMELHDEDGAVLPPTGTTRLAWTPPISGRYYLSVRPGDGFTAFGCADAVGYSLLMEEMEIHTFYLPIVMRSGE